ncbi:Chaperone protein DnaJ [Candidatus Hepatincolaceae symbiont of Richtersius coronifer]
MSKDYYEILEVAKSADEAELKAAYRKLAMKYHPDKNPTNKEAAEKQFKELNEAYEVLKDPSKRAAYDSGAYDPKGGNAGRSGFEGFSGGFGGFGSFFDDIEDVFGEMLGGKGRRSHPQKGNDLLYNLALSLEDVFFGVEKDIQLNTLCSCEQCQGKGAQGTLEHSTCTDCNGNGRTRKKSGFFSVEQVCARCSGSGKVIKNPCKHCSGSGRIRKNKTLAVKIPAGIDEGMRIKLTGEGEAGLNGTKSGDLYIAVNCAPHKYFVRNGNDLYMQIYVPMIIAALGENIDIINIDKKELEIEIPKGIVNGQRIRVKNKGMYQINSSNRGDLFIDIFIETPTNLNKEQIKALQTHFAVDKKNRFKAKAIK